MMKDFIFFLQKNFFEFVHIFGSKIDPSCDVTRGHAQMFVAFIRIDLVMPKRCVCYGCSQETCQLFLWPKTAALSQQWAQFVSRFRAKWVPTKHSTVCCRHFTDDSFENKHQYDAGFASR